MTIFTVLVALEAAAVVLAVRASWPSNMMGPTGVENRGVSRRHFEKVKDYASKMGLARAPLVIVLAYALVDEVVVEAIHHALGGAPKPWRGVHRLFYHAETAIVCAWPAVLSWGAWRVFAAPKRDPWSYIFGAWLVVVAGMIMLYPLRRGRTAIVLHAVELFFVAAALAAIPAGWRSRAIVTREGQALGVVIVTELAVAVLGAWGAGADVFTSWDALARIPYAIGWGMLCVVLIRGRRPEDPAPRGAAQDRRS